jgi:RHS repeat-associated protein
VDGGGHVTCLIFPNQTVAAKYLYDPYGNTLSLYGSLADANVYRFSSKEWNINAGIYYYLYRFYDPNLQRWLNRDPIGERGGENLYGFLFNDDVNAIDIYGLKTCSACELAAARKAYNDCISKAQKQYEDQAVNAINKGVAAGVKAVCGGIKDEGSRIQCEIATEAALNTVADISRDMAGTVLVAAISGFQLTVDKQKGDCRKAAADQCDNFTP